MRIASRLGRAVIVAGDLYVDIETASGGQFSHQVDDLYRDWDRFRDWADRSAPAADQPFKLGELDAPVQQPRQVFAIGLNYVDHASESGVKPPPSPAVFTKFPACLVGPTAAIELPSTKCDWEVELVAVIGRTADRVSEGDAWSYVAGVTVGQDISERAVQLVGPVPQFSLGKSYRTFGPLGPSVVTPDELERRDDLEASGLHFVELDLIPFHAEPFGEEAGEWRLVSLEAWKGHELRSDIDQILAIDQGEA